MDKRTEKLIVENVKMEIVLKVISNYINADTKDSIKTKLIKEQLEGLQEELGREFLKGK